MKLPKYHGIYLLKVNNRNNRTRRETYSKLTIKTSERRHWLSNDSNFRNNPILAQKRKIYPNTSHQEQLKLSDINF